MICKDVFTPRGLNKKNILVIETKMVLYINACSQCFLQDSFIQSGVLYNLFSVAQLQKETLAYIKSKLWIFNIK